MNLRRTVSAGTAGALLLRTATAVPGWVVAVVVLVYVALIAVTACTATFARTQRRRQAALTVLRLLWPLRRPG